MVTHHPQPTVERLSPRVICILGCNPSPYTLNGTNCFLVGTGARRVLIDTGDNPNMGPKWVESHTEFLQHLKSTLEEEQCTLSMILVTHLHGDHFGGVGGILDMLGADIQVGMLEAPDSLISLQTMRCLRERGLVALCEGTPNPFESGTFVRAIDETAPAPEFDTSWDIAGRSAREVARDYHYHKHHTAFYEAWADPADTSINGVKLRHGDVIRVEGATLRAVKTPGHSENHASFCIDEEHSIFSGDNVLGYGTTIVSDAHDYMASLGAMQLYEPARLYPGHGAYIADGKGLLDRYYAHRQAREDQVVELLEQASAFGEGAFLPTAQDIAEKLYTNTSQLRMQQARENIERILLKLWRDGRAQVYSDRRGQIKALLPEVGYLQRIGDDLAWTLCPQAKADAQLWHAKINSITQATNPGTATSGTEYVFPSAVSAMAEPHAAAKL